uniref:Uncharacterized protein n=1 Tax=Leersia perrieri TaxID=77586 RepID=A0A0D9V1I6_9ORYZ
MAAAEAAEVDSRGLALRPRGGSGRASCHARGRGGRAPSPRFGRSRRKRNLREVAARCGMEGIGRRFDDEGEGVGGGGLGGGEGGEA